MPKIRAIKPEFWTDEDIVELSVEARLLFIGLWNLACDNGHVSDKPKQIKMRLLPADDVDADALLTELARSGRIERKSGTVTILNFAKHQKPHRKWWTCCDVPGCKVPDDAPTQGYNRGGKPSDTPSQPLHNGGTTVDHGRSTADVDSDVDSDSDVDGEVGRDERGAAAGKQPPKRAHQLPNTWQPNDAHRDIAQDRRVDLSAEVVKFRDWAAANGATKKDWDATFRNWLRNARAGTLAPAAGPTRHVSQIEAPPDGLTDEELWDWHMQRRAR